MPPGPVFIARTTRAERCDDTVSCSALTVRPRGRVYHRSVNYFLVSQQTSLPQHNYRTESDYPETKIVIHFTFALAPRLTDRGDLSRGAVDALTYLILRPNRYGCSGGVRPNHRKRHITFKCTSGHLLYLKEISVMITFAVLTIVYTAV